MAEVKIKFKSGMGDNAGGGSLSRKMFLELNGERVAASDPRDVKAIGDAFGAKNVAPHELRNQSTSLKGFKYTLKATNTVVLKGVKGMLAKEVSFGNGSKVKIKITKKGMLAKIFTGKFYSIKVKVS